MSVFVFGRKAMARDKTLGLYASECIDCVDDTMTVYAVDPRRPISVHCIYSDSGHSVQIAPSFAVCVEVNSALLHSIATEIVRGNWHFVEFWIPEMTQVVVGYLFGTEEAEW